MQQQKINIGQGKREELYANELKIAKNMFVISETAIPLFNISEMSIEKDEKRPYPVIYFIMILAGIGCLWSEEAIIKIIGLALIGVGGWLIYGVYIANQRTDEFLVLSLNSGKNVYIHSKEHSFTIEMMDVIINCINSNKEYKINMANCKIETCQFGDGNVLNSGKGK